MSAFGGLRRLILPAVVVFLLGLVARMPAGVVLGWVLPDQVATRGITGTLWNGRIAAVEDAGVSLGPVDWQWRPTALFGLRLGVDVEAGLPGGFFNGRVAVGFGDIVLEDVRASAALAPLTQRSTVGAADGMARVSATRMTLADGWPTAIEGEVVLTDLRYAGAGNVPLGGYRLRFDGSMGDDPAFPLAGLLDSDDSGPFEVDGALRLGPGRAYSLNAAVDLRANAPAELQGALRLMPAGPDGRRQLQFEGAL